LAVDDEEYEPNYCYAALLLACCLGSNVIFAPFDPLVFGYVFLFAFGETFRLWPD